MTTLSLHGPLHDRAELEASDLAEILRVAQEQHYAIYESIRSGDERSPSHRPGVTSGDPPLESD